MSRYPSEQKRRYYIYIFFVFELFVAVSEIIYHHYCVNSVPVNVLFLPKGLGVCAGLDKGNRAQICPPAPPSL